MKNKPEHTSINLFIEYKTKNKQNNKRKNTNKERERESGEKGGGVETYMEQFVPRMRQYPYPRWSYVFVSSFSAFSPLLMLPALACINQLLYSSSSLSFSLYLLLTYHESYALDIGTLQIRCHWMWTMTSGSEREKTIIKKKKKNKWKTRNKKRKINISSLSASFLTSPPVPLLFLSRIQC